MSKAFTKESDAEAAEKPAPRSLLPPGARNYLTAEGEARLRGELQRLVETERPPLLEAKAADERALRRVEARIRELTARLDESEIVPPPTDRGEVQFGALVTVREPDGTELEYRLVGLNEVDLEECWISAASPLARTLLGARAGQTVSFSTPGGKRKLRVMSVAY